MQRGDDEHAARSDAARKGLLGSAVGKAEEVAGALLGNDSLTKQGQLRQAEGRARREAGASEAIADTRGNEAIDELAHRHSADREERRAAARNAGVEERAAETDRRRQRGAADTRADVEARAGEAVVRQRTESEISEATSDTRAELGDANRSEAQAAEQRHRDEEEVAAAQRAAKQARAEAARLDPDTRRGKKGT